MTHQRPIARIGTAIIRLILRLLGRLLYRVRANGLDHIPARGAAVLVANHVTFIDSLIVSVLSARPVRFVMYYKYFNRCRWFFRMVGAIPIAGRKEDPAMLQAAMDAVDAALANGELVMIFPEGSLTRDGEMLPFRPGIERIISRRPVPVVPMALRGLWGSRFSRARQRRSLGRRAFELVIDRPIPPAIADCPTLYECVANLRGEVK